MAQINNINNSSSVLTIDPAASADSYLQYAVSSVNKWKWGVSNFASNAFKLSKGSAFGTNDYFLMTTAGLNTRPLQAGFSVYYTSTSTNATGDGTAFTALFNTIAVDQGSNFGSNTFTAPVTGRYVLRTEIQCSNMIAGNNNNIISIVTTARTYSSNKFNAGFVATGALFINTGYKIIADMSAGDTATVTVSISGGTKTVSYFGNAGSDISTNFQGYLIC